jgi:hypothetical protein
MCDQTGLRCLTMGEKHSQVVRDAYENRGQDYTGLFQTLLSVADEVGLDGALGYLERCAIEKRLSWLRENMANLQTSGDPLVDAYRWFYELYLGISAPKDGEIVERSERRLVTRWWNPCPVLEACEKFELDTREICWKAYHQPVQVFLSHIDPRLRFDRNYDRLRPHAPYCEEILTLGE